MTISTNSAHFVEQAEHHMPHAFQYDVFLSHSAKDKAVVRPLAERLERDGLRVWFDDWEARADDSLSSGERASQVAEGPLQFDTRNSAFGFPRLCMSANAFGSDWARLEAGTCGRGNLPFRDPLNKERRFLPLRLGDAPIKGSLAGDDSKDNLDLFALAKTNG